ncbi:PAS domain S-box protein [Streptomyces sp. F001]|uniref:PAS domain S-box protein n=1 Tax=Streptomyces sp. F001 TaxID=1510026 RepID=UPI001F0F9E96|nr:PAS domain S-box protein [Streptomyces sp. F001]
MLRTNDALCRLLGRPASAMRRYSFSDLVHPEDIGTLLRTSAEGGRAELRLGRRDGTYVWVSLRNSVVADAADGPRFLLTHVEDIEERKRRELQLAHRASHDSLTGLPNSAELRSRLSARLCQRPQSGLPAVHDSQDAAYGHPAYDAGFDFPARRDVFDVYDHHVHTIAPRVNTTTAPRGSRSSSATSTASSRSTTGSAQRGRRGAHRGRAASATASATATPSPGSAATSS